MSNSRQIILERIQQALKTPSEKEVATPDFSQSIYPEMENSYDTFCSQFVSTKAQLFICKHEAQFHNEFLQLATSRNWQHILAFEPEILNQFHNGVNFKNTDEQIHLCDASLTTCECLIARTGSMLVSSKQLAGRRLTVYPPVHVVVAYTSQIKKDISDGISYVQQKYAPKFPSMLSLVTGPSRTADIEKTLVLGAHGPKELILFLVHD
jgi:L-lactate dehydrogenase complex protein LldG